MAKKAIELGLSVLKYIKTSMAPGSGVVTRYLEASKLLEPLEVSGVRRSFTVIFIVFSSFNTATRLRRRWSRYVPRT